MACNVGPSMTKAPLLLLFIFFVDSEPGLSPFFNEQMSNQSVGLQSCQLDSFAGSRHPWTCRHGRDIQVSGSGQYLMLDTSHTISCCGYVVKWELQASRRAQIRPIVFQIWRPMQNAPFLYQLIGQNSAWYSRDSNNSGSFAVPEAHRILVKADDVVGWHTPLGDVIDYAPIISKNAPSYVKISEARNVTIGDTISVQGQVGNGRMYGLKAVLQPAPKPVFTNLPRRVTFRCPVSQDFHVADVTSGSNKGQSEMNYSIEGYSPWFQIHRTSGKLSTLRPIHGNFTTQITIRVTSTCEQAASSTLTLECIHLGLQEPETFKTKKLSNLSNTAMLDTTQTYHVTFKESLLSETVLYDASYENTTSDDVICIISDSQPSLSHDVLYTSASLLLLNSNGSLTHNKTPEIHIRLKCIHGNSDVSFKTVIVHVTRDLAPMFLNIPATITVSARQSRVGDVIYHVTAKDRDSSELTISVTACSCPFTVSADGRVTVSDDLRGCTVPEFDLHIFLTDGYITVGPVELHIVIADQNHPPEFVGLPSSVFIPENSQGLVLTIVSSDPDAGDDVSIQWAWECMDAATYLHFDDLTQQVFIRPEVNLDFESLSLRLNLTSLPLLLTLDDGALQSPTQRVHFIVTDQNEAPEFHTEVLTIETSEGKTGSVIATTEVIASVSDPDVDDSLNFHILPGNVTRMVSIDRVKGSMSFSADYDVDPLRMPGHMTFIVKARDKGNLEASVTVLLEIKNVNDPPKVSAPASVTLAEDTVPGSSIFQVYVQDKDSQDKPEVSVKFEDQVKELFDVSPTGVVSLRNDSVLDFETKKLYSFVTSAHDGHVTSAPVRTQLRVTDVNEAPRSRREEIAINAEEGKAGKTISTLDLRGVVTDPDNDEVSFSIISYNTSRNNIGGINSHDGYDDSELLPFSIDSRSGWLFLSRDIDVTRQEAEKVFDLLVEAIDAGGLSVTLKFTVYLKFVNTAPALLGLPAQLTVLEDSSKREVFQVQAIDTDEDVVVFRHRVDSVAAARWVEVNDETGQVKLKDNSPDLAEGSNVKVTVCLSAYDGHSVSEPSTLSITILGVNAAPRFSAKNYSFSIDETEVGIPITSAQHLVTDPDPGDTLTFAISMGSGSGRLDVLVNASSGELCVKTGYDIDQPGNSQSLIIDLSATDRLGLTDTTQVTINIQDINDNSPEVLNEGDTFYVDAGFQEGVRIGQVMAQDRDSGLNGDLRFQIVGSSLNDTNQYLSMDPDGGILALKTPQQDSSITIFLAVTDRGWPMRLTMSTFHVIFKESSPNRTSSLSSAVLQKSSSSTSEHAKTKPIFILIGLIGVCSAAIMALSYQLWKARSSLRLLRSTHSDNVYQDYRFSWFPEQVIDENDVDENPELSKRTPGSSPNNAFHPLSSSTILNSCATNFNADFSCHGNTHGISKDKYTMASTDFTANMRQNWSNVSLSSSQEGFGSHDIIDDQKISQSRDQGSATISPPCFKIGHDFELRRYRETACSTGDRDIEDNVSGRVKETNSQSEFFKYLPNSKISKPNCISFQQENASVDKRFEGRTDPKKIASNYDGEPQLEHLPLKRKTNDTNAQDSRFILLDDPYDSGEKTAINVANGYFKTAPVDIHKCHVDHTEICSAASGNSQNSATNPRLFNTFQRRRSVVSNCPIQVCDDSSDHWSKQHNSVSQEFLSLAYGVRGSCCYSTVKTDIQDNTGNI